MQVGDIVQLPSGVLGVVTVQGGGRVSARLQGQLDPLVFSVDAFDVVLPWRDATALLDIFSREFDSFFFLRGRVNPIWREPKDIGRWTVGDVSRARHALESLRGSSPAGVNNWSGAAVAAALEILKSVALPG